LATLPLPGSGPPLPLKRRKGREGTMSPPPGHRVALHDNPSHLSPIQLEIPSSIRAPPTGAVGDHPLALLRGDSKFSRGVRIGLTPTEENLLSSILEDELLFASIELHCRGVVLTRIAADTRNRKVDEISRLEHELVEAMTSLKSFLEAVLAYKSSVVRAEAELELSNARCAKAMVREEVERKKVADLEKAMEALWLENSTLEAKKVLVEDEFLTQQGNIVLMLGKTFNQVV